MVSLLPFPACLQANCSAEAKALIRRTRSFIMWAVSLVLLHVPARHGDRVVRVVVTHVGDGVVMAGAV